MSKQDPHRWYIPADWLLHIGCLVMVVCELILFSILLPLIVRLKTAEVTTLYAVGVGGGFLGILLLLIARLPLYRQRRFWTVGPRELDLKHRRIYWCAYTFVAISMLVLYVVWVMTK